MRRTFERIRLLATILVWLSCMLPSETSAQATDAQLGAVEFPNSASAAAQQPFLRGVLLLHNFEYGRAREAFQQAQRADSTFALAYWGEALTHDHPLWNEEDAAAARAVLAKLGADDEARLAKAGTERERAWVASVNALYGEGEKAARDIAYSAALEELYRTYPDDENAAAFYALSILGTAERGRDFGVYMRAAAVLEELFDRNPQHPGAVHYLIHSYDDPVHAPLGLRPALVYAELAPDAVHALHMPTHIFFALGMWPESIQLNERSWAASVAQADARGSAPGGYSFHALHWLHYGYLQSEQFDRATEVLRRAWRAHSMRPSSGIAGEIAVMSAAQLLTQPEPDSLVLEGLAAFSDAGAGAQAAAAFAMGYRDLREGRLSEAGSALIDLRSAAAASGREPHAIMVAQLASALDVARGDVSAGIAGLEAAAEAERAIPFEFGPPVILKPSEEVLGDVLLTLGRTGQAAEQYQRALERLPNRAQSRAGLLELLRQARK